MSKKSLFFLSFSLLFFYLFLPQKSFAIGNINQDLQEFCNARDGSVINLETWYSGKCLSNSIGGSTANGQFRGFSDIVLLDIFSKLIGEDPSALGQTQTTTSPFAHNFDGVIPSISNGIAMLASTPAASSLDYLASIKDNLQKHRLVQPAYAEETSFGFTSLRPVLKAWQGLRNIAYAAYILVFIVYGFMIMFRVKIDPKMVTTFELAIPKLIVTLLLVTFSYAIAGLIIDLSYLLSLAIGTAFESAGLIDVGFVKAKDMLTSNGWGFMGFGLIIAFRIIMTTASDDIISLVLGLPAGLGSFIATISGFSLIIRIILLFALAYILFKIFFVFVQAYAKVILQIVFSPIIILGNVLPGNDAFGSWARSLFAELSVFPSTIIMMMISSTFIRTGTFWGLAGGASPISGEGIALWMPPGLGGPLAGLDPDGIARGASGLLGYGILMLTPKIADMVKDALKVPPFKYGQALGEPLKFGYATTQAINQKSDTFGNFFPKASSILKKASSIQQAAGSYQKTGGNFGFGKPPTASP